jgi:hypothetical protein
MDVNYCHEKEIEFIHKEKELSYINVTLSRDEVLAIVAVGGHIGGDGKVRKLLCDMAREMGKIVKRDYVQAADELDCRELEGSVYAYVKEVDIGDGGYTLRKEESK